MRATILAALTLPALAACGSADIGYDRVGGPVPNDVTNALPPDIETGDLRVRDGCYFYNRDGEIFPVTTLEMIRGGMPDQPYCVG